MHDLWGLQALRAVNQWPHSHCWHLDIHTHTGSQSRVLLPENQLEMALNEKTAVWRDQCRTHPHRCIAWKYAYMQSTPFITFFPFFFPYVSFSNHLDPSLFPPLMLSLNTLYKKVTIPRCFFPHPIVSATPLSKNCRPSQPSQKVTQRGFLITPLHLEYHPQGLWI